MDTKHHHQHKTSTFLSLAYHALLQAGPRLSLLRQVHAHLIVSVSNSNPNLTKLLTKLLTLVCTTGSALYARQIFLSIPNPDSFLFNTIIKFSSKFHFPLDSILFYRQMLSSHIFPSNYTFTALIKSCGELSNSRLGRVVHSQVLVCGFGLDSFVQAAFVSFYSKCGDLGTARRVFDEMPERTVIAWNSMISGYEQNGSSEEAVGLFYQMRDSGVEFDSTTFVSVLSACYQFGSFELGCWVHEYIVNNDLELNVVLGSALINMYAKCGHVIEARKVFDSMNELNVVAWTAMISGYGMHGYGREAIELFHQMQIHGPHPNDVTFVAVLSACAHAGLVQEGRRAFLSMKNDYGLLPGTEHHVCFVDMLGRAGSLTEAFEYIKEINPIEPAPALWTAMLGACKMHKNFDLGVQVAEHLLAAEPENPGHYVLLSNIYALGGRMDRVEKVRDIMIRKGLKKRVGYSTIEVDLRAHLFSMGDKSHPETIAIYEFLDELMRKIKEAGYAPAQESVMHELEEEEREYALRYHSEKLAIAYGIIRSDLGATIRIVKNLRMCEDCHSAIKLFSVVANREIIVRDKHRFHHFKDGACSCVDYW